MLVPAVHTSPYAGVWYPGDSGRLRDLLRRQFEDATESPQSVPPCCDVAYVVPHAGLQYSGGVAAAAYRRLAEAKPRYILVVGFPHSGSPAGSAIPGFDSYRTPLGMLRVDQELRSRLLKRKPFLLSNCVDHSLEIQLPLLQFALPDARFLPLYAGAMGQADAECAAAALAELLDDGAVIVASTDLTHYGREFGYLPFEADHRIRERLRLLDEQIVDPILKLDLDAFYRTLRELHSTLCGVGPVSMLILALRKFRTPITPALLAYRTSGDITGDYRSSVSYAAISFSVASPITPQNDGKDYPS